jgi:CRP-like cAMP-binding protein
MKESMVEELFFPKISRETLADIAGTTRSRVSGLLMMLRQSGVIDDNDGSHIRSSLRNIALLV